MARRSSSIPYTIRTNPSAPRIARSSSRHGFSGRSWPSRLCRSQKRCRTTGVGGGVPTPEVGTGGGQAGEDGEGTWTPGGGVQIVEGERRLNRVRIDMKNLPWENWNDIYNEVIDPLAQEGADVRCDVVIIAKGDAAIRENTMELGIKESLGQRGIQADIQTG